MKGIKFDPAEDIPDLAGKVIFITGGTGGLGSESVLALAKHHPEHIYFSGRDSSKADAVINKVKATTPDANITFIECDLASLTSIQKAAEQFTTHHQRLDILMCNAGAIALPAGLTTDGYEVHFGTNHLGHALLIKLLLPILLRSADIPNSDIRIIFLTSIGSHYHPKGGIAFKELRTTQAAILSSVWLRYGQSKLAHILYASELARRYPNITSISVYPGVATTGAVRNLSLLNKGLVYVFNWGKVVPPAEGAWNQLWAATAQKGQIVNGAYYEPVAVLGKHDKESKNEKLAEELWDWTERELEGYHVEQGLA